MRDERLEIRRDLLWLCAFALVLMASGLGFRDPWPADEPRFALIARDMVASGQWLIPSVGNDWYADKPPLFFWFISIGLTLTRSLRVAFLLPSLLAGIGTMVLVYDLARRLWDTKTARLAALLLLGTIQFIWQTRQAQIDATLCFWTTLGLYGLLRHLLAGPNWKWYAIGWAAAGFGVITKGVGFLPLLILIPYFWARRGAWLPRSDFIGGWRWAWGPLAFLLAVCVWLAPMLLASLRNPELAAYRDEILFHQTIHRYAEAWHHREPFWYFIVEVIPFLWLPVTALLPWLVPRWRNALRAHDMRVLLLLVWTALVVLFFSLSTGKRGVYVLPAVPALVLAAAPFLSELFERKGPQRVLFALACVIAAVALLAAGYLEFAPARRSQAIEQLGMDPLTVLVVLGLAAGAVAAIGRPARGLWVWSGTLAVVLVLVGFWINPALNGDRSSQRFIGSVEDASMGVPELGLVGYKEQYLLYFKRPTINFGHARWRDFEQEARDAAAWLNGASNRGLMVDARAKDLCFSAAHAQPLGSANGSNWYLVTGRADENCVTQGDSATARRYVSKPL